MTQSSAHSVPSSTIGLHPTPTWTVAWGEYRQRVLDCVHSNQGAHLREISRRSGIPLGTVLYHLGRLEDARFVVSRRDGRYKRYFAGHALDMTEKETLSALRRDVPRRIAVALRSARAATQRELCELVGVSRSTISQHVNQLIARGVVQCQKARPESRYVLADEALTSRLLDEYSTSLTPAEPTQKLENGLVQNSATMLTAATSGGE